MTGPSKATQCALFVTGAVVLAQLLCLAWCFLDPVAPGSFLKQTPLERWIILNIVAVRAGYGVPLLLLFTGLVAGVVGARRDRDPRAKIAIGLGLASLLTPLVLAAARLLFGA